MARSQSRFVCQACGAEFLRWEGQCRSCAEWNTLVETVITARARDRRPALAGAPGPVAPVPLSAAGEIIPDVGNQCRPAAKMMISGMPMTK